MQKRAALARALIRNPNILYLDEPTTGLDPTRTGAIHDLIRRTREKFKLTVVMVSHDVPQVFEISDRVAFMHQGRMWLNGRVAEVMEAHDPVFEGFLAGRASDDEDIPASVGAETRI
jgi:phospholipid/cholesterol/gamma-HCH transport system ATP-binding protein